MSKEYRGKFTRRDGDQAALMEIALDIERAFNAVREGEVFETPGPIYIPSNDRKGVFVVFSNAAQASEAKLDAVMMTIAHQHSGRYALEYNEADQTVSADFMLDRNL